MNLCHTGSLLSSTAGWKGARWQLKIQTLLFPSRNSGFQFSSLTPTPPPPTEQLGYRFSLSCPAEKFPLCPWSSPGEALEKLDPIPRPCSSLHPAGQPSRAPGLARASFFQLPQTELVLGGQTAPKAVFPPPRMRRRDNSPNPRDLAELMVSAGARWCCLIHIHPLLPESGRDFPAAASPWHLGKCGCLSLTGQRLSPPCSCPVP